MVLSITRDPFLLYETLGMVSMYYTKRSFIKLAENMIINFRDSLSQQQIDELRINSMLIEQFMLDVCSDLDCDSPEVKFYLKPFDTGNPHELNCVARICILSFMKLTSPGFDEQIAETKERWRKLRADGVEVVDFTNGGISFAMAPKDKPVPNLFEQLYSMQYPHEAKMDAFRVLDNFDYYMDKLADILRPYAMRLKEGMPRLLPIFEATAQRWEQSFINMSEGQIQELIRIDPANMITGATAVGTSLFFFNEIGYGYEPGTNDNIATLYFGAGVYPEFISGYVEKSVDRLAEVMKAFTDPIKLEMMSRLFYESDYCLNIAQQMDLNAGNVSRHLTTIYDYGLLLKERRNNRTYYSTDFDAVHKIFSDIEAYITSKK